MSWPSAILITPEINDDARMIILFRTASFFALKYFYYKILSSLISNFLSPLPNIWDKHVWTCLEVTIPVGTILACTLSLVSVGSVDQHNEEKHREEPWEWRLESTNESPCERLRVVGGVVSLTGVFVPAISQQSRAVFTLDVRWVDQVRVRQVRESLSNGGVTGHESTETVLLSVSGIEEVVCNGQDYKQCSVVLPRPVVFQWVVVSQEQSTVTVGKWHTGNVPETEHEAKLLICHVPGWNNQLLALRARVGVKPECIHDKAHLWSDVAIGVVLLESHRQSQKVEKIPWNAHLEKHLDVQVLANSRVQRSAHETVVDVVTGHAVVVLGDIERVHVETNGEDETIGNGSNHHLAEVVDDVVHLESVEVESNEDRIGSVERPDGITEVWQLATAQVRQWLSFRPDSWQGQVEHTLGDEEHGEDQHHRWRGNTVLQEDVPQLKTESWPILALGWPSWKTAIELRRDPHVNHQEREAHHHAECTGWTAELPLDLILGDVLWVIL